MKQKTTDSFFSEPLKIVDLKIHEGKIAVVLNHELPYAWKVAYFKFLPSLSSDYYPSSARFDGNRVEISAPAGNEGIAAHQFQACMNIATLSYITYVLTEAVEESDVRSRANKEVLNEQRAKDILASLNGERILRPKLVLNPEGTVTND